MTPEDARELRDGTVPGPWLCDKDGDEYEFVIGTEDFGIITEVDRESDGRLIAAAPALAELVAGLRHEYAVQVNEHRNRDADWWYWKDNMRTQWFTDYEEAVNVAESTPESARVVRRLVGEPEVVS